MSRPSFSSGERAEACPPSHVLPRVLVTSDAADIGTDIHGFLKVVAADPAARSLALERLPPELRDRCAAIDVASALHGLENVRTETAYAVDVESGAVRFLGQDLGRQYPELAPTEVCGALDVDADAGDVVVAVDWKTGRGEVTPPEENLQVGIQAYAIAKHRGASSAIGRLAFIDEDGGVTPVEHHFNALDLQRLLERWRNAVRRVHEAAAQHVEGKMPTVRAGTWCGYCPARPHCPAIVAFAKIMLGELEADRVGLEMLTPERQGEAWLRAKTAVKLAEDVLEGLRTIAKDEPIPLPDGKEVRPVMSSRSFVNGKRALELLRQRGLRDEDLAAEQVIGVTKFPQFRAVKRKAG